MVLTKTRALIPSVLIPVIVVIAAGTVPAESYAQEFPEINVKVETIARDLSVPWEMAFAPDGRIFLTERTGTLRVIQDGTLEPEPILELDVTGTEGGMLGLALDPDFDENYMLYLYYTYAGESGTQGTVMRYVEDEGELREAHVILDGIPGSPWHNGGRIKFGPDGNLYILTGDAADSSLSQDLGSMAGKILRVAPDGGIPDDNPFGNSYVFSYGHRNPQGLDWHPVSGMLVSSEHGPSGERGVAHDEINIITPGGNYGWPLAVGDDTGEGLVAPALHTGYETWAPSGAAFYDGNIEEWNGKLFVATLRGTHLRMLDIDPDNGGVLKSEALFAAEFGRLRNVAVGPDGHMYIMTSNTDGRGSPAKYDDRILRVVPLHDMSEGAPEVPDARTSTKECRNNLVPASSPDGRIIICVKESSAIQLATRGWTLISIN